MKFKVLVAAVSIAASTPAFSQTEIQWWHSMGGALGEWVNGLARDFNEQQKDYKVVPTFKGSYDESMTAAVAAFRAGNAPHILQVFEVGTATMMASKGAIVPVTKVMGDAGASDDDDPAMAAVLEAAFGPASPLDAQPAAGGGLRRRVGPLISLFVEPGARRWCCC
jgi:sn-glycerol 3-phosphate transport system substrate-binding protein